MYLIYVNNCVLLCHKCNPNPINFTITGSNKQTKVNLLAELKTDLDDKLDNCCPTITARHLCIGGRQNLGCIYTSMIQLKQYNVNKFTLLLITYNLHHKFINVALDPPPA